MKRLLQLALLAAIMSLAFGYAQARTALTAQQDIQSIIAMADGEEEFVLAPGTYNKSLEVIGNQITITGQDSRLESTQANAAIYVGDGGILELVDLQLIGGNSEQAVIFVDGGQLSLKNVTISGEYRFAIYAGKEANIQIDGLVAEGGEFGLYLTDKTNATIDSASFSQFTNAAISGFGREVDVVGGSISIENAQSNALVFREQAVLKLSDTTISDAPDNAVYIDQGASLDAEALIFDRVGTGVLALGADVISIKYSEIMDYSDGGVVVQGASSLNIDGIQISGSGNGISTSGSIASVTVQEAVVENANAEVSAFYLGHEGRSLINRVSISGGVSALFVSGPRIAETKILSSDFNSRTFAAVTLQNVSDAGAQNDIIFEDNFLFATDEAVGIAFDQSEFVLFSNNQIFSTAQPAISFYQSSEIQFKSNMIATGNTELMLGSATTNLFEPSAINVTKAGVEVTQDNLGELQLVMLAERKTKQGNAETLGEVFTENAVGLPMLPDAGVLSIINPENESVELPPNGTGFELPAGTYRYSLDGIVQGQFDVAAGQRVSIELPDPVQPFLMHEKDGQYYRGKALRLRPQSELRSLYLTGQIYRINRARPAVRRPDLGANEEANAVAKARQWLKDSDRYFNALSPETYGFQMEGEAKAEWGFHYRVGYGNSLQILSSLGNEDDLRSILEMASSIKGALQDYRVNVLARAAIALMVKADTAGVDLKERLAVYAKPEHSILHAYLHIEAAKYGFRFAYEYLVDKIAVNRNADGWTDQLAGAAIAVLYTRENAHVTKLALDLVSSHYNSLIASTDGQQDRWKVAGVDTFLYLPSSFVYAAAFAPKNEIERLNIGFLPYSSIAYVSTAFEDPIQLVRHYYGVDRGEKVDVHKSWHQFAICSTLSGREVEETALIEDELWPLFYQWYSQFDGRDHIAQRIPAYYIGAAKSHCGLDQTGVQVYDWARDENDFEFPGYIKSAAFPAMHFFNQFLNNGERSARSLDMIYYYTLEQIERAVAEIEVNTSSEIEAITIMKRVVSDNVKSEMHSTAAKDHQHLTMFAYDQDADNNTQPFWLALQATVALRGAGDRQFVGIALSSAIHADNGLAAAISGKFEQAKTYLQEDGRGLISRVQIRNGNDSVDLTFIQTTQTGQHIFEIPSDLYAQSAVIDIFFADALKRDPLSIPIAATQLSADILFTNSQ